MLQGKINLSNFINVIENIFTRVSKDSNEKIYKKDFEFKT